MKNVLSCLAVLIIMTGTCLGAIRYFASDAELQGLKQEVQARELQRWIWEAEERYSCSDIRPNAVSCWNIMPPLIYKQYQKWITDLNKLLESK